MPPEQNAPAPDITGTDAANAAMPSGTPQGPPMAPPPGTPGVLPDAPNVSNLPAVSNPGAAQAAQNAMAAQQVQQQQAKAGLARDAAHGAAFNFLAGNTPQKPGQMFRSLLAGAILGGAAGGQSHNFTGGFGLGVQAGVSQQERLRAPQQQMFENQLKQQKEQREQQQADREGKVADAEIEKYKEDTAMLNTQQLHLHSMISKGQYDQAQEQSAAGKAFEDMFQKAGIPIPYQNVDDREIPKIWKDNPESKSYQWRPVGVAPVLDNKGKKEKDENGNPLYKLIYDAFYPDKDPRGKIPLTQAVYDRYVGAGMDKTVPGFSNLKVGQPLDVSQVNALNAQYDAATNKQVKEQKDHDEHLHMKALAREENEGATLKQDERKAIQQLSVPLSQNFVADPTVLTKSEAELRQQYASQNQILPQTFSTLYAIGHYDASLSKNYPTWNRRGTTGQMTASQATDFIRRFINPNFDENKFDEIKNMEKEYGSTRNNTAGGNAIAYNTAISHLGMLHDAAVALKTNDIQQVNKIKQWLSVQTGQNVKPNFDSIREALVGEIGKTFKNAAVDQQEASRIEQTLASYDSPDQLINAGVIPTYAALMNSKAEALDAHYYGIKGRHPDGIIDPNSSATLNRLKPQYARNKQTNQWFVSRDSGHSWDPIEEPK
jgi:hypothetical protein